MTKKNFDTRVGKSTYVVRESLKNSNNFLKMENAIKESILTAKNRFKYWHSHDIINFQVHLD